MSATEERQDEQTQEENRNVGRVEEITGVVIEAVFPDALPEIYNALEVDLEQFGEEEGVSAGTGGGGK